jgi:hypothetical protein
MANETLKLEAGRQYPLYAQQSFDYTNLSETGVAVPAVNLPDDAVVVGGMVVVDTAFNTATSAVVDAGDAGDANRYLNDADLKAVGAYPLVPTGEKNVTAGVTLTPTLVGAAATQGAGRLIVAYILTGRANEVQPG